LSGKGKPEGNVRARQPFSVALEPVEDPMPIATDPHSQAADAVHEGRPVEAQYVRQGRRGTHVLWILIISLALVAVGFLAVWGLHMGPFQSTEPNTGKQVSDAVAFSAPSEPAIKQTPEPEASTAPAATPAGGQPVSQ
jgi:hypothetical protein